MTKKKPQKVVIRCRKCWVNVAIQKDHEPLGKCPICGSKELYVHATLKSASKKKEEEGDGADRTGQE